MKRNKPTVAEIARHSGLSPATVSRTLNHPELVSPNTSALVHSTISLLSARAEQPAPDTSKVLQILVNIPDPGNLFYSELLNGILKSADFRGYRVLITRDLLDSPDSVDSIIRQIYLCNIQGMILCTSLSDAGYKKIAAHVPIVQCTEAGTADYSYVGIDNYKAAFSAMEHIYSTGHHKIALLNGSLSFTYARQRQKAYCDFMRQNDLVISAGYILNFAGIIYEAAYASVSQLLASPNRPDAIFAVSDVFAVAAAKAAAAHGLKIPDDLVIVGFDNIQLLSAVSTPPISSVQQPRFQMGYTAGEILYDCITTGTSPAPQRIILPTELIIRSSSLLK
jgi:transcriptional regulator, lacI family